MTKHIHGQNYKFTLDITKQRRSTIVTNVSAFKNVSTCKISYINVNRLRFSTTLTMLLTSANEKTNYNTSYCTYVINHDTSHVCDIVYFLYLFTRVDFCNGSRKYQFLQTLKNAELVRL